MQDPVIETKKCLHCNNSFAITQGDVDFYNNISPTFAGEKFPIPIPTLCPDCRQRRRLSFRNERNLYRRICDASGKQIISIYSPDKPYKVYDQKIWWSDSWDAMDYGRNFDFNKTFTEQFGELMKVVPRFSLQNGNNRANSDYANGGDYETNCYMVFNACYLEDCMYCTKTYRSKDCVDCYSCYDSELCFQCNDVNNSHKCFYSINLKDCNNCISCVDCIGCSYCVNCNTLHNKQYYVNNEFVGKAYFDTMNFSQYFQFSKYKTSFGNEGCEQSAGRLLKNCKNVFCCREIENGENLKYCFKLNNAKNCYDYDVRGDNAELFYECQSAGWGGYHNMFVNVTWQGAENMYCDNCVENCKNCFGCIGLRNKQYCIFNKQYAKEEYEKLVSKIIRHMQTTGERGEFFHPSLSPFGYNETVAQEYYPAEIKDSKLKIKDGDIELDQCGYSRSTYEAPRPVSDKVIKGLELPTTIEQVQDDILQYAIECETSGKLFRIQPQELIFYRKHHIPLPRKHPDVRHLERLEMRK